MSPRIQARIEALTSALVEPALALDDSFMVDARLRLHAQDGRIGYRAEPIRPERKRYGQATAEELREYLDQDSTAAFLALAEDDTVIGRVLLSHRWTGFGSIDDLAVDRRWRVKGVGSALLARAIAWAREQGLPGLSLETQDNNVAACHLYQAHGFELGGFDRYLYANQAELAGETALFWYLRLDPPPA